MSTCPTFRVGSLMPPTQTNLLTTWAGMLTGLSMVMWIKYAKQFSSICTSVSSKGVVRRAADTPFLDAGYAPR